VIFVWKGDFAAARKIMLFAALLSMPGFVATGYGSTVVAFRSLPAGCRVQVANASGVQKQLVLEMCPGGNANGLVTAPQNHCAYDCAGLASYVSFCGVSCTC
jgi:hypothetical protein